MDLTQRRDEVVDELGRQTEEAYDLWFTLHATASTLSIEERRELTRKVEAAENKIKSGKFELHMLDRAIRYRDMKKPEPKRPIFITKTEPADEPVVTEIGPDQQDKAPELAKEHAEAVAKRVTTRKPRQVRGATT